MCTLYTFRYLSSHISDFLRYLTLWRWGGLYLDLDTVTLRSMEHLQPNYVGAESKNYLAAGVMNFAHHGIGKTVAEKCLLYFRDNFNPGGWGDNGPIVITRVLKQLCRASDVVQMYGDRERCVGFQVFNSSLFYEINLDDWGKFFEAEYRDEALSRLNRSYIAHLWNFVSQKETISVFRQDSAYLQLAKIHCPRIYKALEDRVHYL